MNRQIRLVGIGICIVFIGLFAQLNYLQVFHAGALDAKPQNSLHILREYSHPRGQIISADGVQLAYSQPVGGQLKYQRVYPQGSLFGQLTGYFSFTYGSDGVEHTYDSFLTGAKSSFRLPHSLRDLQNELTNTNTAQNVTLTVSANLQRVAQQALGNRVGSVVALDPTTGAILAMYSNPSYDPNQLSGTSQQTVQANYRSLLHAPGNPLSPGAYRDRLPPGSTFKMITASAAYDRAPSLVTKTYPTENSIVLPQTNGQTLSNFGGERCGGQLLNNFTVSCNTAFASMGLDLGADNLAGEAQAFGFNKTPPLDLPAAAQSVFPPASSFAQDLPGLAKSAIGQENVAATPLQMAMVASAFANGGTIMVPHVLDHVTNSQNQVVSTYKPKPWVHATSSQTASRMTTLMESVVQSGNGTGHAAAIPGIQVAGKTGTAQTGTGTIDAWFACFAPATSPKIAVGVVVENQPSGDQYQGGTIAAPIARAIIAAALQPGGAGSPPSTSTPRL
jgi:penicillin-binding protein A